MNWYLPCFSASNANSQSSSVNLMVTVGSQKTSKPECHSPIKLKWIKSCFYSYQDMLSHEGHPRIAAWSRTKRLRLLDELFELVFLVLRRDVACKPER